MCLRKDKIMPGIYTVTLNIKAFLGLKSRGGGEEKGGEEDKGEKERQD